MPKKTADLVALILAVVVAVVVIATAATLLYLQLAHPEQDVSSGAAAMGDILGVLIAALVGYMAGRATGNGHAPEA